MTTIEDAQRALDEIEGFLHGKPLATLREFLEGLERKIVSPPPVTFDEQCAIEAALQSGFEPIDNGATVFVVSLAGLMEYRKEYLCQSR